MTRKYGTLILFGTAFLLSWVGQLVFQAMQVSSEAQQHGETFQWVDFWPMFLSSTFENWQSEFLQLLFQVVFVTILASKMLQAGEKTEIDTIKKAVREVLKERPRSGK